jgi:beta-phosphoglucomutase-like phosphatase (HAD superfamily)
VRACVFELEGVLTSSPALHEAAWAETFDSLLLRRAERGGERYGPGFPFSPGTHYPALLEGRTRLDGVRSFLANRGIQLRKRTSGDPPRTETIHAPADRKRAAFNRRVEAVSVRAYPGSAEYLDDVRDAGLKCAVVSASAHTAMLLERTGLAAHLDARVHADAIAQEQLRTWPAPDVLLAVCARLGVPPHQAAVFETEPDGVAAGRTASFAVVVGVDRGGNREALLAHGADVVVGDLSELLDPVLPLAA